jgi:hypothetical protein
LQEPKPVLSDQEVAHIYRVTGKFPDTDNPRTLEQPEPQPPNEPSDKSAENDQQSPAPEKPLSSSEKSEDGPSLEKPMTRAEEIAKRMKDYKLKYPNRDFGRSRLR